MEQDSSRKSVKDLLHNLVAIREFSICLDPKFRYISNWEEFAYFLGVIPDVITECKLYFEYSPTVRIFEYLKTTRPDLTIDELKDVFTRSVKRVRHDIVKIIDSYQELTGDSKVVDVITNSTSDLLDRIALRLDSATSPVCNWINFGLELGIQRDTLQQFEMYTNYNPTENLLRYVYATNKESLKLNTLLGFFEDMERHNIINQEEVIKAKTDQDPSTIDAKDVFKLGSALLDRTSQLLNRDIPGVQGWERLAQLLEENGYIDIPDVKSSLQPPRQYEIHSSTTKTIRWLEANKPELTIGHLIVVCEKIKRLDAVEILLKFFPDLSSVIPEEQDESVSSQLKYSIQETPEQTEHILNGNIRSLGFHESKTKIVGREKEIKSLVSELSTGDHQLLVLHGSTGIGKETVSVAAARELTKSGHLCVHVTCDGVLSVEDLAVKILTTCGFANPSSNEQEKVKALFRTVSQKNNCILILQNFDHMFHLSHEEEEPVRESESAPMTHLSPSQTNDVSSRSFPTSRSWTKTFYDFFHSSFIRSNTSTTDNTTCPNVPPQRKQSIKEKLNTLFGKSKATSCSGTDGTASGIGSFFPSNQDSSLSLPWQYAEKAEKEKYHMFLEELLLFAPDLKVLITVWESFASTRVEAKQVELPRLSPEESKQLLLDKCKSALEIDPSCIPEDCLNRVIECCSGIPQLLLNAVIVFNDSGPSAGAEHIASSPLKYKLEILNPTQLPKQSRVNYCLKKCFGRLNKSLQKVLVMVTVFPESFTVKNVHDIFQEGMVELQSILNELKKFSFLSHNEHDSYSLTPAMKSFVVSVAMSSPSGSSDQLQNASESGPPLKELNKTYKNALFRFVLHTFNNIEKVEKKFFSTDSKGAIQEYKQQVKNLKEIANWCISDRLSSDQDLERIKYTIIHSFVQFYLITVKLMNNQFLKTIICKFSQTCQNSLRYNKESYIDCLIYGGVTFVLSCLCVPQLCVFAQAKAMWCFGKAIEAACENPQCTSFSSLSEQLEIICKCKVMSEGARTQLLVKYGRYLVRQGRKDHGLAFIRKGIDLRKKEAETTSSQRDQVMVAVGYDDLACAYSYIGYHYSAIYVLEKRVLPVYREFLGIHPFTASALSHLGHNYLALDQCDKALNSSQTARQYRESLLGIHSETARSLFDMGQIIREQACKCEDLEEKKSKLEKALVHFNLSLEMQNFLADIPRETASTHLEIADVLRRLGRSEEASKQDAEIPDLLESISISHVN